MSFEEESMADEPEMPVEAKEVALVWADLLSPQGVVEFFAMWAVSRSSRLLLGGLPFLLVAVGGTAFVLWLKNAPEDQLVTRYETKINNMVEDERYDEALLLMKAVSRLRPLERRYRYQRGLLLLKTDAIDEAVAEMVAISPPDARGYPEARNWLIQQSMSDSPMLSLTEPQLLQQLQRLAEESPEELQNHQLLATFYLKRKQYRLAESHLENIVQEHPQLGLDLAKLQKQIGRDPDIVNKTHSDAEGFFSKTLRADPGNESARIGWASCLIFKNRWDEAVALLEEGLQESSGADLQRALSETYTLKAEQQLNESIANRPSAAVELAAALKFQPENERAILLVSQLADSGGTFSPASLATPLQFFKDACDNSASPDDRALASYAALLEACGQDAEAAEILERLQSSSQVMQLRLAKLYQQVSRDDDARDLFETVIDSTRQQLDQSPDNVRLSIALLGQLNAAGRFAEALDFLSSRSPAELSSEQRQQWERQKAIAELGRYDQLIATSEESAPSKIALLTPSLGSGNYAGQALLRLAQLSFSDDHEASEAEGLLASLADSGQGQKAIHRIIGEAALMAEDFQTAVKALRKAYLAAPDSPVVANNLAVALIRSDYGDTVRALKLVNEALAKIPDQPDFLITRAEVNSALKRWDDAILDLTKAHSLGRSTLELHDLLAKAYEKTGNSSLAEVHAMKAEEFKSQLRDE